jgi:HTH-type transcriptional regulator/antitoxin HigA|tara:strand:+ start:450 stop:632 length:183 start_codon:yes stop_codon:yes gene_type:complete
MIHTEQQYKTTLERVEELLQVSDNIENQNAKGYLELNVLSNLVATYEEENYAVKKPSVKN